MSRLWPVADTSLSISGVAAGIGFGGLIDGIVLHQLLQWHHLISAKVTMETLSGLQTNTFWDGVFNLVCLGILMAALFGLHRSLLVRPGGSSARLLTGLVLVGWGLFNVVDQLVFHLALGLHHIRMVSDYQLYDWGFFAMGLVLFGGVGWILIQADARVRPRH